MTNTNQPATIVLTAATVDEALHLFKIMENNGATCSVEMIFDGSADPMLSIHRSPVKVEYLEHENGSAVVIRMPAAEFTFEVDTHSYSRHISDHQIFLAVAGESYSVLFDSSNLPEEAIKAARSYVPIDEKYFAIDMSNDEVITKEFKEIINHLNNGYSVSSFFERNGEDGRRLYIDLVKDGGIPHATT